MKTTIPSGRRSAGNGKNHNPLRSELARRVIDQAREYLGVPFLHQGRSRAGLDCLGLLVSVAEDLGLRDRDGAPIRRRDHVNYPIRPNTRTMLDLCDSRLVREDRPAAPGDVVVFRMPRETAFLGIVTDLDGALGLIHCESFSCRRVVEHRLVEDWSNRSLAVFAIPPQEEIS